MLKTFTKPGYTIFQIGKFLIWVTVDRCINGKRHVELSNERLVTLLAFYI